MIVKLLTEHHLEYLSLNKAAEARPSLHLSKCQIVGNLMPRLKYDLNGVQGIRAQPCNCFSIDSIMAFK